LIFTMHESERLVSEVRQTGAHGLVLKSQAARDLVRAIVTLLSGNTFFGASREAEQAITESQKKGKLFRVSLALACGAARC